MRFRWPQLLDLYRTVRLAVAPLPGGGGASTLEVARAMALGVPVVATPAVIEGTHAVGGASCLVGSEPRDFVAAVAAAYGDCALWGRLSQGGLAVAQQHHFGEEAAAAVVLRALADMGYGPMPATERAKCRAVLGVGSREAGSDGAQL
jgi:glycosyltransferase involved in cell wall biosynthesis